MLIHLLQTKVLPQNRLNAVKTIKTAMGPTKAKQGCSKSSLYSHVDNDDQLLLVEFWENSEVFEKHVLSSEYDLILEVMELCSEPPKTGIHHVTSSLDLSHIEGVRKG